MPTRVLMVCSGNICRSPTAEGVLRALVEDVELGDVIEVDSAGTGSWHAGDLADPRTLATARTRGIELTGRARKVTAEDFEDFDLVLSVDSENLRILQRLAPVGSRAQVRLLDVEDVPDPYYGGESGFEDVFDQIHAACARLLEELRAGVHKG